MNKPDEIATKLAAAILLHDGRISVADIRAIPFIETEERAMQVAKELACIFDVEWEPEKTSSNLSEWVDVIRLREKLPQAAYQ